jgi:HlyD family secretion protein
MVVGGIGLAVVLVWAVAAATLRGVPAETAQARREDIREFVDERGKTRLPREHFITMPYEGRIEQIALREGDPVKQGQVVARVVPLDLKNAVDEAQAVVQRLQAAIRENDDATVEETSEQQALRFVESMVSTVKAAEARMQSGKAKLDYAEKHRTRVQRLAKTGATPEDELDRADMEFVQSQVDYRQDELTWRAMASIEAATKLLPKMIRQTINRKDLTRSVLEKEQAEAEARLRQALIRQQRGTMTSPVDGVVLERPIQNERQLAAGAILLKIGTLEQLEVEADVLSQDVVDIEPGDAVEIYGPAIGAHAGGGVAGRVDRVFPAGFTKISSLGVEQQRVRVVIHFLPDELDRLPASRDLGVDYRVRVRIFTADRQNALVVPRSALFRGADNAWQVFAVRGGRAAIQPVRVGLMNDQMAEIAEGVSENELVILAPESSLTHGIRVEPVVRK